MDAGTAPRIPAYNGAGQPIPTHIGGPMKITICALVVLACLVLPLPVAAVREPVRARHAMVIAQQPADEAGVRILQQGGNAIDAVISIG